MWSEVAAMRKVYLGTVGAFLKQAQAKGEIPESAWRESWTRSSGAIITACYCIG